MILNKISLENSNEGVPRIHLHVESKLFLRNKTDDSKHQEDETFLYNMRSQNTDLIKNTGYSATTSVDGNNFQKTEVYQNETFIRHPHFYFKYTDIEKKTEILQM